MAIMLLALSRAAIGQSSAEAAQVELVAARAMLAHRDAPNQSFALDPRFGTEDETDHQAHAKARELRPEYRSTTLARALGGGVQQLEAVDCGRCPLKGVSAHLTLSSPVISGSTATVIATLIQNTGNARSPVYYETTRLTLSKTASGWIVTRQEQLGIS